MKSILMPKVEAGMRPRGPTDEETSNTRAQHKVRRQGEEEEMQLAEMPAPQPQKQHQSPGMGSQASAEDQIAHLKKLLEGKEKELVAASKRQAQGFAGGQSQSQKSTETTSVSILDFAQGITAGTIEHPASGKSRGNRGGGKQKKGKGKSKGKGKGKLQAEDEEEEDVDEDVGTSEGRESLILMLAKSALDLHRRTAVLEAITTDVGLVAAQLPLVPKVKTATKAFVKEAEGWTEEDRANNLPIHLVVWNTCLEFWLTAAKELKEEEMAQTVQKYIEDMDAMETEARNELLLEEVRHIRIGTTWRMDTSKLEVSVSGQSKQVWHQASKFMVRRLGMVRKNGIAPRTGLARRIQAIVERMGWDRW